jgi:nucleotide-binding universal stress UspA family protein
MNDPRGIFLPAQRLLLASDLSERSDRALERTIELARAWHGKVDVVTVMKGPQGPDQVFQWMTRGEHDGGDDLAWLQVQKDFMGSGLNVCLHIARGDVAAAVRDAAAVLGSQLVIAGTTRSETLWQRLVGSPTQRLSHQLTQPLLAVRNRVYGSYQRIVIAADFSKSLSHLVETARRLFPGRALTLYHACPSPSSALLPTPRTVDAMAYRCAVTARGPFPVSCELPETEGERLRLVVEAKALTLGLGSYVRSHDVDLVIAGTRPRAALHTVLLGAATDGLLHGLSCDVLLVPNAPPGIRT